MGFLRLLNGGPQHAQRFRGRVEPNTVGGGNPIPTPLRMAHELKNGLHLLFRGALRPGKLGLQMGTYQGILGNDQQLLHFVLALVHVVSQHFFRFSVTYAARARDARQRAPHLVVGKLHSALASVDHVAIGTGNAPLTVDAGHVHFVVGMLRLQDGRPAQLVDEVHMAAVS